MGENALMEFCPKCGMRLALMPAGKTGSKFSLRCPNCNYQLRSKKTSPAIVKKIEKPSAESVVVIGEKEAKIKTLPTEEIFQARSGSKFSTIAKCLASMQ